MPTHLSIIKTILLLRSEPVGSDEENIVHFEAHFGSHGHKARRLAAADHEEGRCLAALSSAVAEVVRVMPLWKLQTIGPERMEFLYKNTGTGTKIELRPAVAYCFRKVHALLTDLVRGASSRYVRQLNVAVLGEATELNEFIFGSERISLAVVRPVLLDIQNGRCFYCRSTLTPASTQVDRFVAWARYPVDLGHNFVLADSDYWEGTIEGSDWKYK